MRLIVEAKHQGQLAEVVCDQDAVYIGSRNGCRVHLPDDRIAAQQAVIYQEGAEGWILQPLDFSVELRINGEVISDRVTLRDGDQIAVQDFVIRAQNDERSALPRPAGKSTVASMTRFVQYQLPPGSIIKKMDEALTILPAQMARLGHFNLRLSQCETIEELMNFLLPTLLEAFTAQRAWVGVRRVNYGAMEYVEGRTITGHATELPRTGENLKPRVLDRGQFVLIPHAGIEEPWSAMTGPLAGPDGTLGMVYLDTGDSGRRYDSSELDFFIMTLNLCAVQLDAIFKQIARHRAALIDGEVSVAHAVQARITPRKLPQWDELQWGAFREPGRERSSDIYDVVKLSNQTAAFMVAHTSAKGPLPSLLMTQAQATFRAAAMHQDPPHIFMRMLNHLLYDGQQDHPLDCFMGIIDPNSGELRYTAAGWMGAYIIGRRGDQRSLVPAPRAPSLGMEKAAGYATRTDSLESGESIAIFTPGVTTARNARDEVFGEERFVNILCDGFGQLASAMLKEMLSDLQNFTQGGKQPDDITVLLGHRV